MTRSNLVAEHVETLDPRYTPSMYAILERTYKVDGVPPLKVRIVNGTEGNPWQAIVNTLAPTGEWLAFLHARIQPQDGYGEEEADRQAELAVSLLEAAREAAGDR